MRYQCLFAKIKSFVIRITVTYVDLLNLVMRSEEWCMCTKYNFILFLEIVEDSRQIIASMPIFVLRFYYFWACFPFLN